MTDDVKNVSKLVEEEEAVQQLMENQFNAEDNL